MRHLTSRGAEKAAKAARAEEKRVVISNADRSNRASMTAAPRSLHRAAPASKPVRNTSRRLKEALRNLKACAGAIQALESKVTQLNEEHERLRRQID